MKKNILLISLLIVVSFILNSQAFSQVTVSGSNGANGTYSTLKLAFDAINANSVQTGMTIAITITSNTTEIASAVLNGNGTSWTSLSICPTTTGLSVSGNLASPLIDLNGAANVTIDGRVNASGSTKDLVITNTSTSATSGTSTVRFINDATNNTVKFCTIRGSETNTASVILFFSTGTTTGNTGNTVDHNDITNAADASRPVNAVYSLGSSNVISNGGNTFSNNNVYNFLSRSTASNGISLGNYSSSWTISANNFYETASFVPAASVAYNIISISNLSGTSFSVVGNYIGGNAPLCAGTAWIKTNAFDNSFNGIFLSVNSGSLQGNTIQNITWSNSLNSAWTGINVAAGSVNVGTTTGNTIGSSSGTGSISFTEGSTGGSFYGIYSVSTNKVFCQSNTIGSVTTSNSAGNATNFNGIFHYSIPGIFYAVNNLIGSTVTPNSINATSASTGNAQSVYGINNYNSTDSVYILGNTIANLKNGTTNSTTSTLGQISGIAATTGNTTITISNNTVRGLTIGNANTASDYTASVCGISLNGFTYVKVMSGNTVYDLSNTYSSFAGSVIGLYNYALNPNWVCETAKNFIYNLSVTGGSSTAASIYGIKLDRGPATCSNNIISLGGNSLTTLYGIDDEAFESYVTKVYFNTIYLGGSLPGGSTNKSYALYSKSSANTRDYRDNIFSNNRSTGSGTSLHYAAYFSYGVNTNLTLDYNDYQATGTGGMLGYYNGSDLPTLAAMRSAIGKDASSLSIDPVFLNGGSTVASDYRVKGNLFGISGTGYTTDYGNNVRSTSAPTMGAWQTQNIEVWTGGILQAGYPDVKNAFGAINAGTHTGILEVRITGSTIEPSSAVLYQSGYNGVSSYSSVNVFPTVTGLFVSGNFASPLLDLNGAVNVTIDGRVNASGNSKDLVITNTSTSGTAGTSTIRFINDASSNTVKYCTLKGSETSPTSGVVFLSLRNVSGNNSNFITNNNITNAADANRPLNAIHADVPYNNGNTISNNNIYDFFNRSTASRGIYLAHSTTPAWSITGNSFYETTSFVPAANVPYSVIYLDGASNTIDVSGNYIGGSAPQCGGAAWTKTNAGDNTFIGIYVSVLSGSIQGNTIQNFEWSNSLNAKWYGMYVFAGAVNVGTTVGNTIGAPTGTGSITYTAGTAGANIYGIYNSNGGAVNYQNNQVGSITSVNAAASDANIYGIYNNNTGSSFTFSNNIIGSTTTANSINASSASSGSNQFVYGIYNGNPNTSIMSGNTIANLTNGTTNSTIGTIGEIIGIYAGNGTNTISNNTIRNLAISNVDNISAGQPSACGIITWINTNKNTVSGNTIAYLSNTTSSPSFVGVVEGIFFAGSSSQSNVVSNNFIHDLTVNVATVGARIYGIENYQGNNTFSNNIISLGVNSDTRFFGIFDPGFSNQTLNLYHNTVYISGSAAAGATEMSYALYSIYSNPNTRNFRNNIFMNARSTTGGASLHYAAYFGYGNTTGLTINNNDYFVSGTGGMPGYYGGANKSSVPIVTGLDANSSSSDPLIVNPGSAVATDYKTTSNMAGASGTGITTDYAGVTRTLPVVGAWESLNKWKGFSSTDWSTASNWTSTIVPLSGSNLIFDDAPANHCILPGDITVNNITNGQSTYRLVTNGHKLTIRGALIFTGGAQMDASSGSSTVEFAGTLHQTIPAGGFLNNNVYNLSVNNTSNVELYGTLRVLNSLSAISGRLDATTHITEVIYAGSSSQTIMDNAFLNNEVYNLTIDNSVGVTLNAGGSLNVDGTLKVNPDQILEVKNITTGTKTLLEQ
ncbi:MAG: hypothetical protein NTW10_13240 [Bacteroidetes bacterium]|nr:hypothetical protein [Bacteroidota bacterium]